jgi:NTE family protein
LAALEEAGLTPDLVVGVSIGAIVGAAYCQAGRAALPRLRAAARALAREGRRFPAAARRRVLIEEDLGLRGATFAGLPVPLRVTATALPAFRRTVLGDPPAPPLIDAVLASSALPLQSPVPLGGTPHYDGGLTGNLPARVATERGCRILLCVPLGVVFRRETGWRRLLPWKAVDAVGWAMMRRELRACRAAGAIVLEAYSPAIEEESVLAFDCLDKLEEEGYKAASRVVPSLQSLVAAG